MRNSFEICARALIKKDGKILVCKNKRKDFYYFPGGHVDFGETAGVALSRELKEELDIKVKSMSFIGTIENIYKDDGMKHHEINLVFNVLAQKVKDKSMEDYIDFFFFNEKEFKKTKVLPLVLRKSVIRWSKDKRMFWASKKEK